METTLLSFYASGIDGRSMREIVMAATLEFSDFNEGVMWGIRREYERVGGEFGLGKSRVGLFVADSMLVAQQLMAGEEREAEFEDAQSPEDGVVALRNWVISQGRSEATATKVVALLQPERLLLEPRPRAWNRRGEFGEEERNRYLWYRHTARLLGWKDRQQFPDFVRRLLKIHIFPAQRPRHSELLSPFHIGHGWRFDSFSC